MEVKKLDWDSGFFKTAVFSVQLSSTDLPLDLVSLRKDLEEAGAGLAYIFLQQADARLQTELEREGVLLYDEKLTYAKSMANHRTEQMPANIAHYTGVMTDELLELALLAGHESRFRKDPRLLPYFGPLYKLWLQNSLSGAIADKVFVYTSGNEMAGMATCKIRNGTGNIGLIATAGGWQGKGVGSALLLATDAFYNEHAVTDSTVVTQLSNKQACAFYEKNGFTVSKKEYVYHWWLK